MARQWFERIRRLDRAELVGVSLLSGVSLLVGLSAALAFGPKTSAVVSGSAPVPISAWSVFGGVQPSVVIDPWDIANVTNPAARLVSRPAIGTVVEGLPSGAYWEFGPKNRYLVLPSATAVRVDDHGLTPYSAMLCRVPNLTHETLAQVNAALLKADCHLGKVHNHPTTRRRHTLRVIKQVPAARTKHAAYYTVGITLG